MQVQSVMVLEHAEWPIWAALDDGSARQMSVDLLFFFFSSRRRHTRCREVSWARRCVQETGINGRAGLQLHSPFVPKQSKFFTPSIVNPGKSMFFPGNVSIKPIQAKEEQKTKRNWRRLQTDYFDEIDREEKTREKYEKLNRTLNTYLSEIHRARESLSTYHKNVLNKPFYMPILETSAIGSTIISKLLHKRNSSVQPSRRSGYNREEPRILFSTQLPQKSRMPTSNSFVHDSSQIYPQKSQKIRIINRPPNPNVFS
eukprot:TRINITY_DN9095_c0_g1_i1.p1 TRINITY_DN9095_c0_g1~~TRINITY_DN9095_c0_g1_i1.p1  ORF type:complete len:257 (+),score=41.59 TRINITY_DN9095_c0_g1_i1:35-805(+)